jgi:hypothetical protein
VQHYERNGVDDKERARIAFEGAVVRWTELGATEAEIIEEVRYLFEMLRDV